MFDTIGRTRKANRQRQAGSMLISMSLFTTVIGTLMLTGGQQVTEVEEEEEPVEVTFFDAAPPPPPPPPPPPAGANQPEPEEEEPEEEEPEEEEPEEMEEPEEIEELPDEIPEPVADANPAGEEGGQEGGVVGGEVGGVVGGTVGGVVGGQLGGQLGGTGVKGVHWSQVKPKRRVEPRFPDAAKALGLKEENCRLRLYIDEKGVPYDIDLSKCPKVFHDETRQAAMKWRFYPYKEDGVKKKATFVLNFKFKLTN